MKQIIPFKKELLFKTKVSEITSISLEHTLTLKEEDLISGEFHISGDYKMTEGSINKEKFNFTLPFDIALDSRYNTSNIIIDIDNFYYEIINSEALQVNIDVYVEGEKQEKIIKEEPILEESLKEEPSKEVFLIKEERNKDYFIEEYTPAIEIPTPKNIILDNPQEQIPDNNFNIFDNISSQETYSTYYVYIVKEEDNLEKILEKYNVKKDDLANYNNLDNITKGTKLIIPSLNNE